MQLNKEILVNHILQQNQAVINNYQANNIEFDSRKITPNNIFIALKGDKQDGHNYIVDAYNKGASLFIVDQNFNNNIKITELDRLIYVSDPLIALHQIAAWWRNKLTMPIIAVTGSAGKTTVKNMIAHILANYSSGYCAKKSFNNHLGVPYTLCNIALTDNWASLELGMNHSGEITKLSKLAKPDFGVITNIEPAHIGNLGSLDNIAKAKLEIINGLKLGSNLIIPDNNDILNNNIKNSNIDQNYNLITFGLNAKANCYITNITQNGLDGVKFNLKFNILKFKDILEIKMPILGVHNIKNTAAAILACKIMFPDIDDNIIKSSLKNFSLPDMRFNIKYLNNNKIIINDAYNANPSSVAAALNILEYYKNKQSKIGIIIGDMLELGNYTEFYHQQIAEQIIKLNPSFVVSVGNFSKLIYDKLKKYNIICLHAENTLDPNIIKFINKNDYNILLIKGSNTIKLNVIADTIS